jgi:hypothetical protein
MQGGKALRKASRQKDLSDIEHNKTRHKINLVAGLPG